MEGWTKTNQLHLCHCCKYVTSRCNYVTVANTSRCKNDTDVADMSQSMPVYPPMEIEYPPWEIENPPRWKSSSPRWKLGVA